MSSQPGGFTDSDSDSDSLPDVSQLIQEQLTQPKSSASRHSTPDSPEDVSSDGAMLEDEMPEEPQDEVKDEVHEEQLPDTPASKASYKNAAPKSALKSRRSSQIAGSSKSASAAATPTSTRMSPPASGRVSRSATRKRAREFEEGASELPRAPAASQPLPQPSKRARRGQPPSASQPLPATPASKASTSVKPEPISSVKSSVKSKAKQKAVPRKRSENFWHLDGSVVVQVQNTLFRLHRSRLAQQSEYFAALQNGDGSRDSPAYVDTELVDSCPVYVVKNVSVLDFERLLVALDAGIAYAINPPPFRVLASLVRAAHALSFNSILTFATHLLRAMWPSDLARLRETSEAEREERVAQATETILLAQQCALPELLKAAYHELLRAPAFGQDLAVYVHAESSNDASPSPRLLAMECIADEEHAPPARLPASDFVRLARAQQALQAEWLAHACAPPLPSAFPCALEQLMHDTQDRRAADAMRRCAAARQLAGQNWGPLVLQTDLFEAGLADVFAGLQRLADIDWKERGYCMGCVSERRDAWLEKREKLWKRLDVLLGLKGEDEQ